MIWVNSDINLISMEVTAFAQHLVSITSSQIELNQNHIALRVYVVIKLILSYCTVIKLGIDTFNWFPTSLLAGKLV